MTAARGPAAAWAGDRAPERDWAPERDRAPERQRAAARVARVDLIPSQGALAAVVASARGRWAARAGVLVRVTDRAGRVGLGEASPLPGYSPDTLEASAAALASFDWDALADLEGGPALPSRLADLSGRLPIGLPAARFAVESAALDLLGQRLGLPVCALVGGAPGRELAVSAVVAGEHEAALLASAEAAVARGLRTLKLKVGLGAAATELPRLAALAPWSAAQGVRLRLDFNGAAGPEGGRATLADVAEFAPELVEEPMPLEALAALARAPAPIALDESLTRSDAEACLPALAARGLVSALVLKPMALGGFSRCLVLARRARDLGLAVVVTHLFDGPVAHAAATHLALAVVPPGGPAMGLDLHPGLEAWTNLSGPGAVASAALGAEGARHPGDVVLRTPVEVDRGRARVPARPGLGIIASAAP